MTHVYEYDVFISYQRDSPTVAPWVRTHFFPELSQMLDDLVEYDVKIFAGHDVPAGTMWPAKLREALQRTRVLVPVCSPKYFQNEWCLAEWHSMAKREEVTGMASAERPEGLIYPVIFSDSQNFPPYAHQRHMQSLTDYAHHLPLFQTSLAYLDFRTEVKKIAEELVVLFDRVPEWRPDWPVETPAPEPPRRPSLPRF